MTSRCWLGGDTTNFFYLDKNVTFVNNGSYGAVPKCVKDLDNRYGMQCELNPDLWMRKTSIDLWFKNREAVAPYFRTNPNNLAFTLNATSGVNAVLSSIVWQPGDVILITNITYPALKCACDDFAIRNTGVEVVVISLPYPVEKESQLVDAFESKVDELLENDKTPRLAIVDAISSMPAVLFPFEKIVRVLQNKSVQVLVDGAHAPGQIELNLDALGADYFAGNLHKWFFSPKGTAIFYCSPRHQSIIRPPIVSIDNSKVFPQRFADPMSACFFWQGTMGYTGFACVSKAIEFANSFGGFHEVANYNNTLASSALDVVLANVAGSSRFEMPDCCQAPFMPMFFGPPSLINKEEDCVDSRDVMVKLYEEENVWVALSKMKKNYMFRLSCQIYNSVDDYYKLATAINNFASCSKRSNLLSSGPAVDV